MQTFLPRCCSSAFSGGGWAEYPATCSRRGAPASRRASRPGPRRTRVGRARWGRSRQCRCRAGGGGDGWDESGGQPAHLAGCWPDWAGSGKTRRRAGATWLQVKSWSEHNQETRTNYLKHEPLLTWTHELLYITATQWRIFYVLSQYIFLKAEDVSEVALIFLTNIFTTLVCSLLSRVWL